MRTGNYYRENEYKLLKDSKLWVWFRKHENDWRSISRAFEWKNENYIVDDMKK